MDIAPIDDVRSTAAYRGTVAGNLLERFLDKLADAEEARPSRPPPTR